MIDAVPKDDLTVELSWHSGADLDLHLVAPGGVPFCDPLDCYWDTCMPAQGAGTGIPVLDWGDDTGGDGKLDPDGSQLTDPILVYDNQGAAVTGADTRLENMRLPSAPVAGGVPYLVAVHHFDNKGAGPVEATVRVVYRGAILWEATHTFGAASGGLWRAGEVDVSTGSGAALSVPDTPYPDVTSYVQPSLCP